MDVVSSSFDRMGSGSVDIQSNGKGLNSEGKMVRFDNVPSTFDAYFKAFPKLKEKYELKE